MRASVLVLLLLWLAGSGLAAESAARTKHKSTPARKVTSTRTKPSSVTKKASSNQRAAPKKSRAKKPTSRKKRTPSWRLGQQTPTAERYREIQQALLDRGYLQAAPTGEWEAESTDALRRFQQDQHLEPTGKLDSLSLIALGLGPKRGLRGQDGRQPPPGREDNQ